MGLYVGLVVVVVGDVVGNFLGGNIGFVAEVAVGVMDGVFGCIDCMDAGLTDMMIGAMVGI